MAHGTENHMATTWLTTAGAGFAHGFLAQPQVVKHRRVTGEELAAPVLAGLEQAAVSPAGQRFLTHSEPQKKAKKEGPWNHREPLL